MFAKLASRGDLLPGQDEEAFMREIVKGDVLAVRATGGLHVVTLAWDFAAGQDAKRYGLLGLPTFTLANSCAFSIISIRAISSAG